MAGAPPHGSLGASAGRAVVGGAIGIVNGTATGVGCAIGTHLGMTATWAWDATGRLTWRGPTDDRVARACFAALAQGRGAHAATTPSCPPARGLKTSSQAAAALLIAAHDAEGVPAQGSPLGLRGKDPLYTSASDLHDPARLVAAAVAVSRRAGVTITGAWDDQWSVISGGCHVVDNATGRHIARPSFPPVHVAIWVPDAEVPKHAVATVDASAAALGAKQAAMHAARGDFAAAMRHNTDAFLPVYEEAGLPVTREPVDVALAAGALAAGLSGTGPAVGALFERPCSLAAVDGGAWTWTRTRAEGEAARPTEHAPPLPHVGLQVVR